MSDYEGKGDLLEPLSAYKTKYESAFKQNCTEYFNGLVKESGMSEEENRRTVAAYQAECKKVAALEKKLEKYRAVKGLMIFLIVLGAVGAVLGVLMLLGKKFLVGAILLAAGAALIAVGAGVLAGKIKPLLKHTEEKRQKRKEKADGLLGEAWEQMSALNALFEGNVTKKLIRKTVPLLELDDWFNMRRYDYLNGKYGYGKEDDPCASTLGILTGEIVGNPFVVDRELVHFMGTQTYTGSLVISWTTTHVDSKGNVVTDHHSQTLTASVTKPKPFCHAQTRLIYGNEAAPSLHFSRSPAHAEDLSEKEREKKVKKGKKRILEKQKRALEQGGTFTEMGNEEFDVLFGALDRDNEVEFRLLFTPLAQKNMLALLTDAEGYGDDFRMEKDGCLNYISSEHSASWDMRESRTRYASYSVDIARKKFMEFNEQYFRSLYFDLAPLLSIPLYQQQKPREYLYKESYPRTFTRKETEFAVNSMDPACFAPPTAATASILKTNFLDRDGKSDRVRVTANAYEAHDRVDYIAEMGGDGRMHEVPVPWVEYVPVSATQVVKLKEIGLSDRDFAREAGKGKYRAAMQNYGRAFGYNHGILCCVVPDTDTAFDKTFEE